MSAAVSPSPRITAIGVLTATSSVPAATSSFPTMPSSTASTSIVALSVSISARMVPDFTTSPSFTSHLASLPSSMVGESAGIRISVLIRRTRPCRVLPRPVPGSRWRIRRLPPRSSSPRTACAASARRFPVLCSWGPFGGKWCVARSGPGAAVTAVRPSMRWPSVPSTTSVQPCHTSRSSASAAWPFRASASDSKSGE